MDLFATKYVQFVGLNTMHLKPNAALRYIGNY